jgi:SNF family Na+-dependent transporter
LEGLYTSFVDEFEICRQHKYLTRFLLSFIPFLVSLPTVTYGGSYVIDWLDAFSISPSLLIVVLAELIVICWVYGLDKFKSDIKSMNGSKPFIYWGFSWKYTCPLILGCIVLFTLFTFRKLQIGPYIFPTWSNVLGFSMNAITLLPIPIYALYRFIMKK